LNNPVVHIDSDLSNLIPGFLANKRNDANKILAAAEIADFAALSTIGHKIKGEGGSYGLDAISDIGAEIEHAAKEKDVVAIRRHAQKLALYVDSVEIVYG
jgi:hypothetical protein